jgi:hypothetical protein
MNPMLKRFSTVQHGTLSRGKGGDMKSGKVNANGTIQTELSDRFVQEVLQETGMRSVHEVLYFALTSARYQDRPGTPRRRYENDYGSRSERHQIGRFCL